MAADSGDPVLVVDQEKDPVDDTKLPNSHSAALVMALIFLCVFGYCVYRVIRRKCQCCLSTGLTATPKEEDYDIEGLEDIIKQREDYLAIYGPKKNINSISGAVSKSERTGSDIVSSRNN